MIVFCALGLLFGIVVTLAYLHLVRYARRRKRFTSRQWVMGPLEIPPTEPGRPGTMVKSVPQVLFKPNRIVIPHPEGFRIADIKCGVRSQLINANPVPATTFASTATDAVFNFDTIDPGLAMTLEVINETDKPLVFIAAVFGAAIDDWHKHPLL